MEKTNNKLTKSDLVSLEKLRSGNETLVLEEIIKFRKKGNINTLSELLHLFLNTESPKIKIEIENVLIDVKEKKAIPLLISTLQSTKGLKQKELLAICWQMSLDFSDYLNEFVHFFIEGNFELAFEAFTLIENIEQLHANIEIVTEIKTNLVHFDAQKKTLAIDLVHIIENGNSLA